MYKTVLGAEAINNGVWRSSLTSNIRSIAQSGLAHLLWEQRVEGSNPSTPTKTT